MSRRAARRPRKSSCLYLSWAFPGWNKGGGGGLFLSLRLFSTLLLLVIFPSRSLPDEMGTQPRRPRRLQTFLSELFTELQFLVFATFLYITDPSLVFFFRQLFLYVLLCVSFFFFFFFIDTSPIDLFTPCPRAINRERMYYYYYDVQNERTALKKNDFDSIKMY